jgi:hypothetical protein
MGADRILVKPHFGSSAVATSAISQLVVGSHPGELDAGGLTNQVAAAIAPDEILRPQALTACARNVDAGVTSRPRRAHADADTERAGTD